MGVERIKLSFAGKQTVDEKTLKDYDIKQGSQLNMTPVVK